MPIRAVGELRWRPREEDEPDAALPAHGLDAGGLELERSRSPEWATEEAAGDFVRELLERKITDRGDIEARAAELGTDLAGGAGRADSPRGAPRRPDRRVANARSRHRPARRPGGEPRGARGGGQPGGRGRRGRGDRAGRGDERLERAAGCTRHELDEGLIGFSRRRRAEPACSDPVDLHRAGQEALLAANVGEAEGRGVLAFEDTGAYRLLLPAMSEDPAELERFYSETVEPLVAYDEQYETDLVNTVETYLDNDGNAGRDRPAALHPSPHDSLPARAAQRALRARRHLDRGPREARASG